MMKLKQISGILWRSLIVGIGYALALLIAGLSLFDLVTYLSMSSL